MTDRNVRVTLTADVDQYVAAMKRARQVTRRTYIQPLREYVVNTSLLLFVGGCIGFSLAASIGH